MMQIVGMNYTTNESGKLSTTIHMKAPYEDYYKNPETGRSCVGERVESLYVGNYDCSTLKVGMMIDIFYDKAVQTKSGGTYQPIKQILAVKN